MESDYTGVLARNIAVACEDGVCVALMVLALPGLNVLLTIIGQGRWHPRGVPLRFWERGLHGLYGLQGVDAGGQGRVRGEDGADGLCAGDAGGLE